jgi:hypothetical protein
MYDATTERDPTWRSIGFWTSILTAVCAAVALAIGVTTPARSGPNCSASCVTYPYTDAAAFIPRDYIWLYPALLLALLFVVLSICIHQQTREERRLFSGIAVAFALIGGISLAADYFIQLAVMQPALLKGETAGLSPFSMYNPHGIFIALEDLGYLMMSVSFLFTGLVFAGRSRLERVVRWVFIVGFGATIASLAWLSLVYRENLEYRFEVAAIGIDWTVLIVAGALLSALFWHARTLSSVPDARPWPDLITGRSVRTHRKKLDGFYPS